MLQGLDINEDAPIVCDRYSIPIPIPVFSVLSLNRIHTPLPNFLLCLPWLLVIRVAYNSKNPSISPSKYKKFHFKVMAS